MLIKLRRADPLPLYSWESTVKADLETMVEMMGASRSARIPLTCVKVGTSKNGRFAVSVESVESVAAKTSDTEATIDNNDEMSIVDES
jgi:hypothetical protein